QDYKEESPALPPGFQMPSDREMEILALVAAGFTNKQIAERLVVSLSTVKSHIHHICTKLDAANRTQEVTRAREMLLIE
ncbi:MAG TPA: helix-turn-helix transcriptional regulator, partial [Pelolinea sp.]|nr:helix-turn-helix transcriptional regulator [Pelolinea sp.]